MRRIVVGNIAEIPVGGRKIIVPFRGRAGIGVFNVNGELYALRNICPHKRGPLCTGELTGHVAAAGPPSGGHAELTVSGEGEVLRCPWHQWPFEIATGRCLVDSNVRVKTYPVRKIGTDIVVELDD